MFVNSTDFKVTATTKHVFEKLILFTGSNIYLFIYLFKMPQNS